MVKGPSRRFYLPFSANATWSGPACRREGPVQSSLLVRRSHPLTSVEQLSDDPGDTFVALANQHRPQLSYRLPSAPDYLTPLLALTLIRAYLVIGPQERLPG